MISTTNVTLQYGGRVLFKRVTASFSAGNCYGVIGANGTGKSTFLKVLSGEVEPNEGDVIITPGERLSMLRQDHFAFDEVDVLKTVLLGNKKLCDIMDEKEALYSKADFSDEDGMRIGELEAEFTDMDGYNAESEAEILLAGLGVPTDIYQMKMKEISNEHKVKVLLAQALFGNPDILLLDEPTNHLDLASIRWLENFLINFQNTVIVVSHDRYFLNKVCTNIADIDFGKITMFVGNYDFWYQYTQMTQRQEKEQNKKTEAKMKELQEFIQRFSANASKAKQATSRGKLLDNLSLNNIKPSSRRYPFIAFKQDREVGNDVLEVSGISKTIGSRKVLDNVSFVVRPQDKIAFVGTDVLAKATLFKILAGELAPDEGSYKWGVTTTSSYFPSDNSDIFDGKDMTLVDWMREYTNEQYDSDIRGWLGRMLFSGEEALKKASVLSGGERVRCMLSRMMVSGSNVLILDEPTNHLDLESITALNEGLQSFKGTMLFTSHDHQLIQTISNRIIEILPDRLIDRRESYDEYLDNLDVAELRSR